MNDKSVGIILIFFSLLSLSLLHHLSSILIAQGFSATSLQWLNPDNLTIPTSILDVLGLVGVLLVSGVMVITDKDRNAENSKEQRLSSDD